MVYEVKLLVVVYEVKLLVVVLKVKLVGIGLGGEVVGSGFEIKVSGGFAESCLDTIDCKLYFNSLKLLIVLHMFKANLAFPGSTRCI